MPSVLPDDVAAFVRTAGDEPDDILRAMDERAESEGFPHVGPEVGQFLRLLAKLIDAERVFEFGSGYGYSAYWLAGALPSDGELVLTEMDASTLEAAKENMSAGGFGAIARYEVGDALETIERCDGPFDLVLLDHEKHRYREAFEAVKPKLSAGGAIVADNAMTAGGIEFENLLSIVEGNEPADATDATRGIAAYLTAVTADPAFETVILPLGEGIAVSYRQ